MSMRASVTWPSPIHDRGSAERRVDRGGELPGPVPGSAARPRPRSVYVYGGRAGARRGGRAGNDVPAPGAGQHERFADRQGPGRDAGGDVPRGGEHARVGRNLAGLGRRRGVRAGPGTATSVPGSPFDVVAGTGAAEFRAARPFSVPALTVAAASELLAAAAVVVDSWVPDPVLRKIRSRVRVRSTGTAATRQPHRRGAGTARRWDAERDRGAGPRRAPRCGDVVPGRPRGAPAADPVRAPGCGAAPDDADARRGVGGRRPAEVDGERSTPSPDRFWPACGLRSRGSRGRGSPSEGADRGAERRRSSPLGTENSPPDGGSVGGDITRSRLPQGSPGERTARQRTRRR